MDHAGLVDDPPQARSSVLAGACTPGGVLACEPGRGPRDQEQIHHKDGNTTDPDLLRFLSPLGWEHTNLTGGYTWPRANHIKPGKYRPLRRSVKP